MSASLPAVDRPIPSVAIVGTDAVLAAAPATPVQLAHACLRRGFTVAVPASWGDELVASETLRRLKARERGPAVMCVCPFARARLLGPGPDLAPFLVSLVSPPVAVARYLRSAYGGHGVRITYIGSCPGADDPDIDARITPDAFIAELAEWGISLAEQPLVFDSIVPPDRRRWCSLPGGAPNADMLWADTDGRTLIEIERDDVTTELAQHIIAREHVLLDLAPSLGCACSGVVGVVPPERARAGVTSTEPPRALSAVIDPAAIVSLDVPVSSSAPQSLPATPATPAAPHSPGTESSLEQVLDELLGAGSPVASDASTPVSSGNESAIILDLPELSRPLERLPERLPEPAVLPGAVVAAPPPAHLPQRVATVYADVESFVEVEVVNEAETVAVMRPETGQPLDQTSDDSAPVEPGVEVERSVAEGGITASTLGDDTEPIASVDATPASETAESHGSDLVLQEPAPQVGAGESVEPRGPHVRRRTPPAMLRYAGAAIPKATVANGKPLPRAYVAKRRTPPAGAVVISAVASPSVDSESSVARSEALTTPPMNASAAPVVEPSASPIDNPASPRVVISTQAGVGSSVPSATARAVPSAPPDAAAAGTPKATAPDARATAPANAGTAASPTRSSTHPGLVLLLVTALVALAVFVVLALRR